MKYLWITKEKGMRVLVLEDDKMLQKALVHHFEREGHKVWAAGDGNEALRIIASEKDIDAIVCDVMMPGLSGPGFILSLKEHYPKTRPVIVIITSVKDGQEFIEKLEIPYDHFLQKPVNFYRLSEIIKDTAVKHEW